MKLTTFGLAMVILPSLPAMAQDIAPPVAQTRSDIRSGATVYGPQGAPVGTIERIAGGIANVNTGSHVAPLPLYLFTPGPMGPTIAVNQPQLNALIEEQLAAAAQRRDAALMAGAPVMSADNQVLGTIVSATGDSIVMTRSGRNMDFVLSRDYFALTGNGLQVRATLAQIDQALPPIQPTP